MLSIIADLIRGRPDILIYAKTSSGALPETDMLSIYDVPIPAELYPDWIDQGLRLMLHEWLGKTMRGREENSDHSVNTFHAQRITSTIRLRGGLSKYLNSRPCTATLDLCVQTIG